MVIKKIPEKLIAIILLIPVLNYYLSDIMLAYNITPFGAKVYTVIYILSILAYVWSIFHINLKVFMALISVGIIYLVSFFTVDGMKEIVSGDNIYFNYFTTFWLTIMPLGVLTLGGIDLEYLTEILAKLAVLVNIALVANYVIRIFIMGIGVTNYMSFAYEGLFAVMVSLYYGFLKRKYFMATTALLAVPCILLAGCRGAAITLILFLVLAFISIGKDRKPMALVVSFVLVAILVVVLVFFADIILALSGILNRFGAESRILEKIASGDFFNVSGRDGILEEIFPAISWLPKGFYADFSVAGTYAHNWVIEVLCDFGIIIGFAIVTLIILITVDGLFNFERINKESAFFGKVAFVLIWGKYLVSSSFLFTPDFVFLISMLIFIRLTHSNLTNEEKNQIMRRNEARIEFS